MKIKKNKNLKSAIINFVVALAIYVIASFMLVMIIYEEMFTVDEKYEHRSFMSYDDMNKYYTPCEISFDSNGIPIYGKIYGEASDRLVIIGHGIDGTAEDMLAEAKFFLDNGYSVMLFDSVGHGKSGGTSKVGIHQAARDMEFAVDYAAGEGYSELYLYGMGVGGYAAASCADMNGVKAVASVSAFGSVSDMTLEYAVENMTVLGYLEYPIMMLYQYLIFGSELKNDAFSGINNSNVPIVIINGTNDNSVLYDGAALINKSDKITNENVTYLTVEDGMHASLMRTGEAVELLENFNMEAYALYNSSGGDVPVSEIEAIYAKYDREQMSELNPELMNKVLEIFSSAG